MLRDNRPKISVSPSTVEEHVFRSLESLLNTPELSPFRIGVDIVDIVTFEHNKRVGGRRWLTKLFTENELKAADGHIEQLATTFAAKEAVVKVLQTGFRGISPLDIEVTRTTHGIPCVALHRRAQQTADDAGITAIPVSLSRDCGVAIAVALGLGGSADHTDQEVG